MSHHPGSHLAWYARNAHPGLPLSIVAHSMGSLISTLAMLQVEDVKCAVFTGAAIFQGPDAASPFGIRFLYPISQTAFAKDICKFLASFDPKGPAAPLVLSGVSSNPEVLKTFEIDPDHNNSSCMNKTAYEFLLMNDEVKANVSKITVPLLCMHGESDTITLPKSSEFFIENCGETLLFNFLPQVQLGTSPDHKRLITYPNMKHDLFNEAEKETKECIDECVKFVQQYCSP